MGKVALRPRAFAARRALSAALPLVVALSASRVASAEPSREERALADVRFREGRELLDKGHVDEACAKFEESDRVWPRGGTALNLAACREKQGRPASAWAGYAHALELARNEGRADREEIARGKVASLEGELSWLVIRVPAELDVPGLVVTRDGVPVGRGAWGIPVPADPGRHVVGASAPGVSAVETVVDVGPRGDRRLVTIPRPRQPDVGVPIGPNGQYPVFTAPPPPPKLGAPGVVRLHVDAPPRMLGVYVESSPEQPFEHHLCNAPCDAVIDGRDGERFFFEGDGARRSSTFDVSQRTGDVTARVSPGSPALAVFGYAALITGAAAVPVGVVMLLIGGTKPLVCAPACNSPRPLRPGDSTVPIVGGVALGAGAAIAGAGLAMALFSRTTFKLEYRPAAVKTALRLRPTPSGLAVSF